MPASRRCEVAAGRRKLPASPNPQRTSTNTASAPLCAAHPTLAGQGANPAVGSRPPKPLRNSGTLAVSAWCSPSLLSWSGIPCNADAHICFTTLHGFSYVVKPGGVTAGTEGGLSLATPKEPPLANTTSPPLATRRSPAPPRRAQPVAGNRHHRKLHPGGQGLPRGGARRAQPPRCELSHRIAAPGTSWVSMSNRQR